MAANLRIVCNRGEAKRQSSCCIARLAGKKAGESIPEGSLIRNERAAHDRQTMSPQLTVTAANGLVAQLQSSVARVIRGKDEAIRFALIALLGRGHLLIEDVPGVGKTTLAQALAHSFHCTFQRVQFTSDMLPSDVLGISIYNQIDQQFEFKPGPIFANVVLADEIPTQGPPRKRNRLCSRP